jgi:predicted ribosome quality control (RQC) complex YloA/Tae2 family protein
LKIDRKVEPYHISNSENFLQNSIENQNEVVRKADLLTSFLHTWKSGDFQVSCLDFETQEEVKIEIPIGSTPAQVAKKLYNTAKKQRRSNDILDILTKKVTGYLDYLAEISSSLDALDTFRSLEDIVALREIVAELDALQTALYSIYNNAVQNDVVSNALTSTKSAINEKRNTKQKKVLKSTMPGSSSTSKAKQTGSSSHKKALKGILVLENKESDEKSLFRVPLVVGRNSKQNERVSFDIARNHHVWFHVQGSPGSHCLLLLQPGELATDDDIQSAADVAAFYSKARDSKNV